MEVQATNMLIQHLFKKGEFEIPNYQREYEWDAGDIEELLEDISESEPDSHYFIGHMVFEGKMDGNKFQVIDGQQRLTTITILLCVIRDRLYTFGEEKAANNIHNTLVFTTNDEDEPYPILRNMMPYPILQKYVQSKPEDKDKDAIPQKRGEKHIVSAYDHITKYLKKYSVDDLKTLRDKVKNLETIFVVADGVADASTIFMTLNATGKDLTSFDLVKNFLFSKYPKQPHLDEPNDSWKMILQNITSDKRDHKGDIFLNNSFASRYKKVSKNKIFKGIIQEIKNKDPEIEKQNAKRFVESLKEDSLLYRKITSPKSNDWKEDEYYIYEFLYAMSNNFSVKVANAFLMAILREYEKHLIKPKQLKKTFAFIERFHFVANAICSNRSSGVDNMYSKFARMLTEASEEEQRKIILKSLANELEDRIPSLDEFKAVFNENVFYLADKAQKKYMVDYVLNKLERAKNPNAILVETSIEHIYPQVHDKWEYMEDEWIGNIGNMVLLDKTFNSAIGNKVYSEKRSLILNQTHLITTKEVLDTHNEWNQDTINSRNIEIMETMYKLGKLQ